MRYSEFNDRFFKALAELRECEPHLQDGLAAMAKASKHGFPIGVVTPNYRASLQLLGALKCPDAAEDYCRLAYELSVPAGERFLISVESWVMSIWILFKPKQAS